MAKPFTLPDIAVGSSVLREIVDAWLKENDEDGCDLCDILHQLSDLLSTVAQIDTW